MPIVIIYVDLCVFSIGVGWFMGECINAHTSGCGRSIDVYDHTVLKHNVHTHYTYSVLR